MLIVFEVHVAPGSDPATLLTAEIQRETQAQVMTHAEAAQVGFGGLPAPPPDHEVRFVVVATRDKAWIQRALEGNEGVAGFKMHEIG
jgi:hypothetical protein